ncbi:hypothetical protein THAOC_24026, partial [Thalassiosira oceanica]
LVSRSEHCHNLVATYYTTSAYLLGSLLPRFTPTELDSVLHLLPLHERGRVDAVALQLELDLPDAHRRRVGGRVHGAIGGRGAEEDAPDHRALRPHHAVDVDAGELVRHGRSSPQQANFYLCYAGPRCCGVGHPSQDPAPPLA